jgi:hypothetical protein
MKVTHLMAVIFALGVFFGGLGVATTVFVYHVGLALFVAFKSVYKGVGKVAFWVTIGLIIALWGGGLAVAEFQQEIQSAVDLAWECGFERIFEWIMAVLNTIRKVFVFLASRVNDIVQYLINCIKAFANDVQLIGDLLSLEGFSEFLRIVWDEIMW